MRFTYIILILCWLCLGCEDDGIDLTEIEYNPELVEVNVGNPLFPILEQPDDNKMTVDGVDLGRHLFYDPILSSDLSMSCSSCHLPAGSFTDNKNVSIGVDGIAGKRSSMSLINVGFNYRGLFWDGRINTLEEQALLPIEDPIELHNSLEEVVKRLKDHDDYPEKFRKAFGISQSSEINADLIAKAIAQFERSLISSRGSKFDKVILGLDAFTDEERMGYDMFFDTGQGSDPTIPDAQCFHCHDQPLFTSNTYDNNGLDYSETYDGFVDLGFGMVTGIPGDNGKFRTPTLRNIEFTAPYMHDGRFSTLEEVVDHYISGGQFSVTKSPFLDSINLNNEQKMALISFLKTLSDQEFLENPAFSNPF